MERNSVSAIAREVGPPSSRSLPFARSAFTALHGLQRARVIFPSGGSWGGWPLGEEVGGA